MVKKFLLCAALFGAFGVTAAAAADLPTKAPPPPPPPAGVFSWTGFYIGAGIGGGWMRSTSYGFSDPGGAAFFSCGPCGPAYDTAALTGSNKTGWFGGLRFGYNWQVAPTWLVGVEADIAAASFKQSASAGLTELPFLPVIPGSNLSFQSEVQWLASLRGRLGIVQNNWLFYGTGGVAFASIKQTANAQCPPPAIAGGCVFFAGTTSPFSATETRVGFAVGAGLEWQMPASPWRLQAEYLYYGFDKTTTGTSQFIALPGGGPLPCFFTPTCSANYSFGKIDIQTLKLGLAYAF
jgi:outer membrane immunogenic protein